MNRADLAADPVVAYAEVAKALKANRDAEADLIALRAQIHREIVAVGRGGVARLADTVGVTHTQAGRLLVEDLVRATHRAAQSAGLDRSGYAVHASGQAHPARVRLALVDDGPDGEDDLHPDDHAVAARSAWIGRMNAAGALLDALHAAGLAAEGDGLAVDDGDHGPRAALARLDDITVTWS